MQEQPLLAPKHDSKYALATRLNKLARISWNYEQQPPSQA